MPVHLVFETRSKLVSATTIRLRAQRMLDALQMKKAELSIVITGDKQIHKLNKLYRKKDRPTDVLAFALREGEFSELSSGAFGELLGDVIISLPTAARQAKERDVAVLEETTMLLAHGLLHLLGWDHRNDAEDRAMRKETDRLVLAATRKRTNKDGKRLRQT
ncbi:MAG: rRNA maturation RNase YbeY [Polyangiaceae bacterium]